MNACELGALRRLLMLSAAEAARWVACDELRPAGVEERTWNRWESGKVPVPDNIARQVGRLAQWRAELVQRLGAQVSGMWAATRRPVPLVWYTEAEDYLGPPAQWRPHCSALAATLDAAQRGQLQAQVELVPFDAGPFNRWRLAVGLEDDEDSRSRWAEEGGPDPLRAKDCAA